MFVLSTELAGSIVPSKYIVAADGYQGARPDGKGSLPNSTFADFYWAAERATGDFMMTCPARRAARAFGNLGHDAHLYLFDHTPEYSVNEAKTKDWGAFHGSEVPFVFYDAFELSNTAESALSTSMETLWTSFAETGVPNAAGVPDWGAVPKNAASDDVPTINFAVDKSYSKANITILRTLRQAFCDFFDAVNTQIIPPVANKESEHQTKNLSDAAPWAPAPTVFSGVPWNRAAPLTVPRFAFGTCFSDNQVFVAGGLVPRYTFPMVQLGWQRTRVFEVLDTAGPPQRWFWQHKKPMPVPHAFPALVYWKDDNAVYSFGGIADDDTNTPSDIVQKYLVGLDEWVNCTRMPSGRAGHTATLYKEKIYIIGGVGEKGKKTPILVFDPKGDRWSSFDATSIPRMPYSHVAASIAGRGILIAGGLERNDGFDPSPVGSSWLFQPGSNIPFTALGDMPRAVHGASAAFSALHQSVVVLGGMSKTGLLNVSQAYDVRSGRWNVMPDVPTPRLGLGAAAINGGTHIMAVGGASLAIATDEKPPPPYGGDIPRAADDPTTGVAEIFGLM